MDLPEPPVIHTPKELRVSPKPPVTAPIPHRIPRELPPPFYPPSERRSTPTSATSSSFAPAQSYLRGPQMFHQSRPSANGLIFGGYPDSSSASPAPPSAGYMGYGPAGSVIPPNLIMNNFVPAPMGHSHHGSETHHLNMLQPVPQGYGPPNAAPWYPAGPGYGVVASNQPIHHNGIHLDGGTPVSRSPSQTSSHAHEPSRGPSLYENGAPVLGPRNQQSTPPYENGGPIFLPPQRPPFLPDHSVIHDWLAGQFENPEFADFTLRVAHTGGPTKLPIHGVLAARSPCLYSLITESRGSARESKSEPPILSWQFLSPLLMN